FELSVHDSMRVKFGGMICYESVFPNFAREFVRRGANFLIVVTNDSWWGNTSGAYQHASYASLRAVETRRWIVQAANGGISLVVDPTGVVRYKTHLYEQDAFIAHIEPETNVTFYVQHGDIFAQICLFGGLVILIFTIFTNVRQHRGG
ncbi:MAG: apolipoprotein N-acyltransferase, partial [Bacteroidetes bacterium]|nr:apolipoprotein N-acyltransferase [Bacteroidota bacterium]